jgi:prepilin-type N-terminal cleavage/methylation domain-containing protein
MRNTYAALAAHRNRRHSGFSLVELAMVLAIVALLVAGIMLFFSNASTANKTNDAMTELAAVQQVTRSLYAGQPDYTGLDTAVIAAAKQLPNKWVKAGTSLTSPFSSAVTVVASTTNSANDSFTVTFNGLPDTACNKMVTMDLGTSMLNLSANGTAVPARAMTPAEANASCNNANNDVVFWTLN